jgi:hypothetical protein
MDFLSLADGSVTRGGRLHGCLTYQVLGSPLKTGIQLLFAVLLEA